MRSTLCESFEVIERRAGKFNGLLRKVGHRLKEQQLKDVRSRIDVGNYEIVEVNSVGQLRSQTPLVPSFAGVARGMLAFRRAEHW